MVAQEFIDQQYPIEIVLQLCSIPRSSYYSKPKPSNLHKKKGIVISTLTKTKDGKYVSNEVVVKEIKTLLEKEFVDYGYIKVTYYLQDEKGYLINHKKVYRLMKENNLLRQFKDKSMHNKTWVKQLVPEPSEAFTYWEFDIKFIYIHQLGRYAPLLSIIDVYTRYLIGWTLEWSVKKEDVVGLFDAILNDYEMPNKIYVRNDNGSQFESTLLREYLNGKGIIQEFTKPATPEQNAHIESYHSIIASAVCSRFEFESLSHAQEVFMRWEHFYNNERIHSGIGYKSPNKFIELNNIVLPKKYNIMAMIT